MERTCDECKYCDASVTEDPCNHCHASNEWKPKEEKMNETARPNYEEELKRTREQLEAARDEIEELKGKTSGQGVTIARLNGMIDGLKFALRCNGVSGGEV